MDSRASTDKFGDGNNKNTNQSINDTFEMTNMIGGASIEVPDRNHVSVDQGATKLSNEAKAHASKYEEGNSSIDQPSFQTEIEGTFLWNNAKIIQNSVSQNSPAERSHQNRQSHERRSFPFENWMGQQ